MLDAREGIIIGHRRPRSVSHSVHVCGLRPVLLGHANPRVATDNDGFRFPGQPLAKSESGGWQRSRAGAGSARE